MIIIKRANSCAASEGFPGEGVEAVGVGGGRRKAGLVSPLPLPQATPPSLHHHPSCPAFFGFMVYGGKSSSQRWQRQRQQEKKNNEVISK